MTLSTAIRRPSSSQLLARVLETPDLPEQVRALPGPVLARLIDRVGLEDAGELVAFATTEQLAEVFDEDLWKSERPGEDERFDADRFLVWLEVMLEAGEAFVAQKLVELPPDLVTLALHKHVLVIQLSSLMSELEDAGEDADQIEKALSDCLYEEIDEYQIVARRHEGWDAVLTALLALDRDHHDFLMGVLERCCAMSAEHIEDNGGLYAVLTSEEMLESDVAADREDRRAEAGHVAPSSAAGFLGLARTTKELAAEHDPLTRAWRRGLRKQPAPAKAAARPAAGRPDLGRLLESAGVVEPPKHLLTAGAGADVEESLLIRAMRRLAEEDSARFVERSEELAYLANVLAAGCSFRQRKMRPAEALRAAIATSCLGLELSIGRRAPAKRSRARVDEPVERALAVLRDHPADALFRIAWARLSEDVVLPAAATAERRLREAAERRTGLERKALARAADRVRAAAAAGAPWKALAELDHLEGDTVAGLRGLMDECPSLTREGREAFISTAAELAEAREVLSRA